MEKIEYKRLPYMYQGRKIYEWEQTLERDLFSALVGLFAGSLALALLLVCHLCDDGAGDAPAGEYRGEPRAPRPPRRSHQ